MADILSKRIERVSESILSNEAFTAQFEDDAADLLLNWALKRIGVLLRFSFMLHLKQLFVVDPGKCQILFDVSVDPISSIH